MLADIQDQLGNQMFTYASLKCVCRDTGQAFRWYSGGSAIVNSSDRTFGLAIDGGAFPNVDLGERVLEKPTKAYTWLEPWPRTTNFLPEVYSLREEDFVRGHLQCECYFIRHRDEVRHWFLLNDALTNRAWERLQDIRARHGGAQIVSVHFRRGYDYRYEGRLIHPDYYRKALACLREKLLPPETPMVALLFSDAPLPKGLVRLLRCACETAGGSLFEDLALMQLCDCHVVSNSTFAWWGAWLDEKESCVLRPSVYPVKNGENYPDDIFPESWISIEARRESHPVRLLAERLLRRIHRK